MKINADENICDKTTKNKFKQLFLQGSFLQSPLSYSAKLRWPVTKTRLAVFSPPGLVAPFLWQIQNVLSNPVYGNVMSRCIIEELETDEKQHQRLTGRQRGEVPALKMSSQQGARAEMTAHLGVPSRFHLHPRGPVWGLDPSKKIIQKMCPISMREPEKKK